MIDDFIEQIPPQDIEALNIISRDAFLEKAVSADLYFNVSIGDSQARKKLWSQYENDGVKPATLIAPNGEVDTDIGAIEGGVFCQNTLVTTDVSIGKGCQVNIYSYIAHDCVIGDFVTFAPRVSCNGNVRIEDGACLGTGTILSQGSRDNPLVIGAGATVGMDSVETKNVEPGATFVGIPAKPISK